MRVTQFDNTGAPTLQAPLLTDALHRADWAAFTQLNIPIVGDANQLPLIRRLEIEGSWRHDQYSDVGGISVPKIAFNWMVSEDIGLTLRGSWGTSFRAPGYGELSPLLNNAIAAQNQTALNPNSNIPVNCGSASGFRRGSPVASLGRHRLERRGGQQRHFRRFLWRHRSSDRHIVPRRRHSPNPGRFPANL